MRNGYDYEWRQAPGLDCDDCFLVTIEKRKSTVSVLRITVNVHQGSKGGTSHS